MFLHLFGFFNFFDQCFAVLIVQVFDLFDYIYFISFNAIVSGIVFLSYLLNCLLLVYIHVADFCVLTLHPSILLNSFILKGFCFFWWTLEGVLHTRLYHPQTGNFTSSFSIWSSFSRFPFLD